MSRRIHCARAEIALRCSIGEMPNRGLNLGPTGLCCCHCIAGFGALVRRLSFATKGEGSKESTAIPLHKTLFFRSSLFFLFLFGSLYLCHYAQPVASPYLFYVTFAIFASKQMAGEVYHFACICIPRTVPSPSKSVPIPTWSMPITSIACSKCAIASRIEAVSPLRKNLDKALCVPHRLSLLMLSAGRR